jgi:predicted amidophosphoribosyltransferase
VPLDGECAVCLAHPPAFTKARAILRYDDVSRAPILALKHADRLDLVPGFSQWLERAGRELIAGSDLIVPVPLHPFRLWRRRYNQAAELARAGAVLSDPQVGIAVS